MRATLIILSLLLIGDTLFASQISNPNLGVYLPALLGLLLLRSGCFTRPCSRLLCPGGLAALVRLALVGRLQRCSSWALFRSAACWWAPPDPAGSRRPGGGGAGRGP